MRGSIPSGKNSETSWTAPAPQLSRSPAASEQAEKCMAPAHRNLSPTTAPQTQGRTGPRVNLLTFWRAAWGTSSVLPESYGKCPGWEPLKAKIMVWTSMHSLVIDLPPSGHRLSGEKTQILASPWGGEEVEHVFNIPAFWVLPKGPASVWERKAREERKGRQYSCHWFHCRGNA